MTISYQNALVGVFALSGVVFSQSTPSHAQEESQRVAIEQSECGAAPYSILVTVRDVRKAVGTITADLHGDDPDKFLGKGQYLDRVRAPAIKGDTLMCIPVASPGVYAIALYHDEDTDRKFDKNWIGLPSEPFGLTNDPKIRLAKPKHKDVAFMVAGPLTPVTATLHH
ncbi:MAG: DUF2141 domain-containing protein [Alphaproteobacteria bacterium]|nr:DUF2141 domain-containing protein [Alphaproteobacteria bacterium]